jgi:hypothetical protein
MTGGGKKVCNGITECMRSCEDVNVLCAVNVKTSVVTIHDVESKQ